MRSFAEYLAEAYPTNVPSTPFGKKLANFWHMVQNPQAGPIDWNKIEQDKANREKAQQDALQRDDPAVRQEKLKILDKAFLDAIKSHATGKIKGNEWNAIQKAVYNIAYSFTMGRQLHGSDLHTILVAIHNSSGFDPVMKSEMLSDHSRLMEFFRQIFEHTPEAWYNPEAHRPEDRYPPQFRISQDNLNAWMDQWENSPYRYQMTQVDDRTIVDEVINMFQGKRTPDYQTLKTVADAMAERARDAGQMIKMGNLRKLRQFAQSGGNP